MIYDPTDASLCMNNCGVLFSLYATADGKPMMWHEVQAGVVDEAKDFRRPEW